MLRYMWILFLSCFVMSCDKEVNESVTPIASNSSNSIKYLALGDSYTIGQSVSSIERFPYLTVKLLRESQVIIDDPEYIASTGWTTLNLINAILERKPKGPYDIVTLLIGVNDQYQKLDTAGYRLRFTNLLNTAIELSGNRIARVFVLSIPDYSATPFIHVSEKERVSKEIDAFNVINKHVSNQRNVVYIDINPVSKLVATDPTLLANDGLHYSEKEHQIWAKLLAPYIRAVL